MHFHYEIYPEKQAIVTTFAGHFSLEALQTAVRQLWDDPRYQRDFVGIVDLMDTSTSVAIEDFRAVVEWVRASDRAGRNRWAAVASSPLATACALLYQRAMSDRQSFEVFSTWKAACRFIEVDLPPPGAGTPVVI